MNYTLMPSLEHRALIRTAITLWIHDDLLLARFSSRSIIYKEWRNKVIEKLPKLLLPEPLKKKVLDFIYPIGLEILQWMYYHESILCEKRFVRESINKLCWTSHGTVDKKKTAEALIKDENLDITKRYKLACIYCLEDDVRELWGLMPQRKRVAFYNKGYLSFSKQHELVEFWTYAIKGVAKLNDLIKNIKGKEIPPYQYAFEHAAADGNKVAVDYFLQKLTPGEREESLVRCAGIVAGSCSNFMDDYILCNNITNFPKEDYSDVLCFLLSQMNEEQQIEVFKEYPHKVLERVLDWPWQSFFMETANRMWDFLSGNSYCDLLHVIVSRIIEGFKGFNYQELFGEFWQQSPNTCKKYVINCGALFQFLISELFNIEDNENVRLILKNATVKEKEKIIFHNLGKHICERLIYSNKWDLLKFFVQECISSEEVIIKFKEEFKKYIISSYSGVSLEIRRFMLAKFFQLLDDLFEKDDKKRDMEEENSRTAKRLCNLTSVI